MAFRARRRGSALGGKGSDDAGLSSSQARNREDDADVVSRGEMSKHQSSSGRFNTMSRRGSGGGGGTGSSSSNVNSGMMMMRGTSSTLLRSGVQSSSAAASAGPNILDSLPSEYRYNPATTEPVLHYLPRLYQSKKVERATNPKIPYLSLRQLLKAASGDIRLHRARVQAGIHQDTRLIRSYQLETDELFVERQKRLYDRKLLRDEMMQETESILNDLESNLQISGRNAATTTAAAASANTRGLTQSEQQALNLAKWQRALELYVYSASNASNPDSATTTTTTTTKETQQQQQPLEERLNWQGLFEKLLDGITEDQDISSVLQKALAMCTELLSATQEHVDDASQVVQDQEAAYQIRLEAHAMFMHGCSDQVKVIEGQFQSSGRAALQIGHQLMHSETQRSQCETASVLIRRWWILENLAEQEAAAAATPIPVQDEIMGHIAPTAARLDYLFTKPENSLEASRALQQLRAVVRARGHNHTTAAATAVADATPKEKEKEKEKDGKHKSSSTTTTTTSQIMSNDKSSQRRFDITANLIGRVSTSLEERLLTSFTKVYTAGGIYDFGTTTIVTDVTTGATKQQLRTGAIDWQELRALATSLLLFDSGRNLHKRYVDMVVECRFPELFESSSSATDKNDDDDVAGAMEDDNLDTFTKKRDAVMSATRTKLSTLFLRVSEVCTAEFELIAKVFGAAASTKNNSAGGGGAGGSGNKRGRGGGGGNSRDLLEGGEFMPLIVSRALLQRVISDPHNGLQARINDLLTSIDKRGDFDAGAKKLDTFVIIHEKAAGLFTQLRSAASRMEPDDKDVALDPANRMIALQAVESLKGFLNSQELALSNIHRQSYVNLELRLLHHDCCCSLDEAGCTLVKSPPPRPDSAMAEKGILEEYRAPVLPLHTESLEKVGLAGLLTGPLKQSVLRQPLMHATESLARTRLMFGTSRRGGEATARVVLTIYNQMSSFYGEAFLYPIIDTLKELLITSPPGQPPALPFDESEDAPDLGVSPAFWVALERIHSASKSFDRELWAEDRTGSERVYETLRDCGDTASVSFARGERTHFYAELERRGEAAILQALDALSAHVQWLLVSGGESMLATGGTRMLGSLTGSSGGPYAIPAGSSLDTPNSPAVKGLAYCLRVQFVHVQTALTPQSLSGFWTAMSMRLYDILVARLLQYYLITTVGAVILSRDVDALRSVAMLSGSDHTHWDNLRELLTLYMTPPDAIKSLLLGPEGEPSKGLFAKAGKDQCLVFLSRRNDYRYKTTAGMKKSVWVSELLEELGVADPTDGTVNIALFSASRAASS